MLHKLQFSFNFPLLLTSSKFSLLLVISISAIILQSCAPSTKFTSVEETAEFIEEHPVRVLLSGDESSFTVTINSKSYLYSGTKRAALINSGNRITFSGSGYRGVMAEISGKSFYGEEIRIEAADKTELISINNAKYRGSIRFINDRGNVRMINSLSLEDYVKGVMTKEMPVGKGRDNYEALKAFAICVRTYTVMKMGERKEYFDLYKDVRDQVYGGASSQHKLSDEAVDATKGLVLTYDNMPAVNFYHSTCGGYTESVKNVFNNSGVPYLNGVRDGSPPYCSISPRFNWQDEYTEEEFIRRLADAGLISSSHLFRLNYIKVNSRFPSERVNELEVSLFNENREEVNLKLFSNNIRSVIRNSANTSILQSTMFDVTINSGIVVIKGRGFGHGVGMCQYGAIGQSISGRNYRQIINHYFPGINISKLYD